jgi:hypothetical protein
MDDDMLDVEDDAQGSEPESSTPHLKRPFDLLIAAAMERNPTQFQLPNELTCTTALPGTSKKRRRDEMTGKNVKRPQHELDHNGLVPLPVKVCYPCGRYGQQEGQCFNDKISAPSIELYFCVG